MGKGYILACDKCGEKNIVGSYDHLDEQKSAYPPLRFSLLKPTWPKSGMNAIRGNKFRETVDSLIPEENRYIENICYLCTAVR